MKITDQELKSSLDAGKSMNDIAKEFKISLSTVRYWCKKLSLTSQYGTFTDKSEKALKSCKKGGFKNFGKPVDESHLDYQNWSEDKQRAYSYLLGFYLGDGCLSYDRKRKGRSYTLMITNHIDFIVMNQRIKDSMKCLFPNKEIHTYQKVYEEKKSNGIDIKLTGVNLNLLFPHGDGPKHTRKIELLEWQQNYVNKFPQEFIKGLIESDGCRFVPRKKQCPTYIIYQFSNCSLDIHNILQTMATKIGLKFTFRTRTRGKCIKNNAPSYYTSFNDRESFKILESFIGPKC